LHWRVLASTSTGGAEDKSGRRGGGGGGGRGTARERERDGDDADDLDSLAQFLPNCLQLAEGILSVNFLGFFSGQETLKERFIVRLKWFWN
jgi:hypothetical protein